MNKRWYLLTEDELIARIQSTTMKTVELIVNEDNEAVPTAIKYARIRGAVELMEDLRGTIISAKLDDEMEQAREREADGKAADG